MLFSNRIGIRPRNMREVVTLVSKKSVTDDHGMQALQDECVCAGVPASVVMLSGYAKDNFYQTADIEAYEVRMRYVPKKFEYIIWDGETLCVDSIEDIGMRHVELKILASRRAVI